jgi:hypothetical protein
MDAAGKGPQGVTLVKTIPPAQKFREQGSGSPKSGSHLTSLGLIHKVRNLGELSLGKAILSIFLLEY